MFLEKLFIFTYSFVHRPWKLFYDLLKSIGALLLFVLQELHVHLTKITVHLTF
jgi:hypothetical protein